MKRTLFHFLFWGPFALIVIMAIQSTVYRLGGI